MSRAAWFPVVVGVALVAELVAAAVVRPERFAGFGWEVRGVLYPALVAAVAWLALRRDRSWSAYAGVGLVAAPFWSDVTATWLDLYARFDWWDDAGHFGHWLLLGAGLGLLVVPSLRPRWVLVPLVAGSGALLAVLWELLEYELFYRERGGPYVDTLGDLALGTAGSTLAAVLVLGVVAAGGWDARRTVERDA